MPEIFHRRNSNVSIRQALTSTRLELLPDEIREDNLARWVMDFDDLRSRDRFERRIRSDRDKYSAWALDLVVVAALQRQIPFYFATLFQIGRQWKVSESAIASIESASLQENLRASVRLNERTVDKPSDEQGLGELYGQAERDVMEALTEILRSASEQHSIRLREARQWWRSWRDEVRAIRAQVDRLQKFADRRPGPDLWNSVSQFLVRSYAPSPLRQTLEASGVRFVGDASQKQGFPAAGLYMEAISPLLFLGLSLGRAEDPFTEHFFFEWRHILQDMRYEIENGEARRIALERLVRRYSEREDPFEPYLALGRPATEQLRNLVIEHTLPGNQFSPWLSTWRRCVEFNSATALKVPHRDFDHGENLSAFARGADCAIKQSLPGELRPGETWPAFIQRLFETEWVVKTAGQLVLNQVNARVWRFDDFAALVVAVAAALNDFGYRIEAPSGERLRALWGRLHGDNPWSISDW